MTVKVIRVAKAKRIECRGCGALLEYRLNDASKRNYTACGSPETGWFIDCPNCKGWVEVPA